jgi:hypothetical protein
MLNIDVNKEILVENFDGVTDQRQDGTQAFQTQKDLLLTDYFVMSLHCFIC